MLYILDSMEELKVRLLSEDYGKHLMGVEDLLQKHALVEADINVLGERVKMVVQHSQRFLETEATGGFGPCDPAIIVDRVQQLEVNSCRKFCLFAFDPSNFSLSPSPFPLYWIER